MDILLLARARHGQDVVKVQGHSPLRRIAMKAGAASLMSVLLLSSWLLLPEKADAQQATTEVPNPLAEMRKDFEAAWSQFPFGPGGEAAHPPLRIVQAGFFNQWGGVTEVASPDGKRVAGTDAGNLYVRARDGEEKRFLARAAGDGRWDIEGAVWSNDGQSIAVRKVDDAQVPRIVLTGGQFKPTGTMQVPYSRAGEALPTTRVFIVDTYGGKVTTIQHGLDKPSIHIVGWSGDGGELRLLRADRFQHNLELLVADTSSGQVRVLLNEPKPVSLVGLTMLHGYTRQLKERNIVVFMLDNSFVWTSDRTGYRHLYHYDARGRLLRSLTDGHISGWVDQVLETDTANRLLFVRTQGHLPDPYSHQLLRVALDSRDVLRLADGPHIPQVKISTDKRLLWAVQTGFPDKLQIDEITSSGSWVKTVWKADWTKLKSTGYVPPEITTVLAADGKTSLRAMGFKPVKIDADRRYPVVQQIYAGPNVIALPESPRNSGLWTSFLLAQEGFVVVMLDGRGTPGRGRDFQNFGYGKFGQVEIADHVAGLRALAKEHPYMDMSRVGVRGGSWGGYWAARAPAGTRGLQGGRAVCGCVRPGVDARVG